MPMIALRPGEFALTPRGVPHTYRVGDEPARWLVTSTPAGFEPVTTFGSKDLIFRKAPVGR